MPDDKKLKRRSERRNKKMPPNDKDANTGNMVTGLKAQSVFLQSKAETAPPKTTNREELLGRTSLTPDQIHCLKDIPLRTIRRAWFTSSHLLLEPGAIIAIMGCSDSAFPYAMAIMNPTFHIIGIDPNKDIISTARETWKLENLEFVISKLARTSFPESLFDAIVDSFALQDIFHGQTPQDGQVQEVLNHHLSLLKKGGALFLREYTTPPPNEYVLMEMPDTRVDGVTPVGVISEPDLLLRFSEEANADEGQSRGFFLEELSPINEGTRLFRLMYKWAYEFILRKDNIEAWENGEPLNELTFMTPREFRKTLRHIGSRVVYTAPIWDSATVRESYLGHFKLYDDDRQPLGYPPTSHVFVARKVGEGQSLRLEERRPSREPGTRLHIQSMRNSITGEVKDIISRDIETVEFLPYRITDAGRLHIYLHDGIPRAVTNAVPRSGRTLDDKRWAGYMIEAISVDREVLAAYSTVWTKESTEEFALKELSLRPEKDAVMEKGPEFFPNPQFIDERIETFFLHTTKSAKSLTPKWVNLISKSFSDNGVIREFDAQHVLNAISVGFIPNSRLEMLIMALFNKLGLQAESWAQSPIHLHETDVPTPSFQEFIKQLHDPTPVFEDTEETAGDIRTLHSYFVDTGYEDGHVKGLAANDVEFVIREGETINTAVVIPLMKNMNGDVLAGYIRDYLPVPQRFGKSAKRIRAPSFNLPPEVKDMEAAKAYIGKEFDVPADKVMPLGESYLLHNAITPQRIYPFAVLPEAHGSTGPGGTFTEYAPIRWLWTIIWHLDVDSDAVLYKEALERMHHDIDFGLDLSVTFDLGQDMQETIAEFLPINNATPLNLGSPFKTPDVIEAHHNPELLLNRIHQETPKTTIPDETFNVREAQPATIQEPDAEEADTEYTQHVIETLLDEPRPDKN